MMLTAIGLMSGTSLDGVDVAMIETDGRKVKAFGPSGYRPYTDHERGLLRQALTEAVHLPQRDARPGILREAEEAVTKAHAEAVITFTAQHRITREEIDIVGFHGQTVLHRPEKRMTVQIGDATALAKAIHIPVMHDFRAADFAAGGHGAPLVPVYHRALAHSPVREGPIAVVNICGGARNRTMMRMLRERLEPAPVEAAEGLGWSSDALEAQAFGFLAARGLKGLPLSYPATTGVPMPMTGGVIARP